MPAHAPHPMRIALGVLIAVLLGCALPAAAAAGVTQTGSCTAADPLVYTVTGDTQVQIIVFTSGTNQSFDFVTDGSDTTTCPAGVISMRVNGDAAANRVQIQQVAFNATLDLTTNLGAGGDSLSLSGYDPIAMSVTDPGGDDTLDLTALNSPQQPATGYAIDLGPGNDSVLLQRLTTNGNPKYSFAGGAGTDTLSVKDGTCDEGIDEFADDSTGTAGPISSQSTGHGCTNGSWSAAISGFENFTTGDGNDTVLGSPGANVISTGAGDDTVIGGLGSDTILPGTGGGYAFGNNPFDGTTNADVDTLSFSDADTTGVAVDLTAGTARNPKSSASTIGVGQFQAVQGSPGPDTVTASTFGTTLIGGAGDDSFTGGAGTDIMSYADRSSITPVSVSLAAPAGGGQAGEKDVIGTSVEGLTGGAGADTLIGNGTDNVLDGGAGDDTLRGADGNDTLTGGLGDDTIDPGDGADAVDGGAGTDTVSYATQSSSSSVSVDLSAGTATSGVSADPDTIANVENATGGRGSDQLTGSDGPNVLLGGDGRDTISGGGGSDTVDGQDGDDVVSGGAGDDVVRGGDDDDQLSGGDGTDTMDGGDGDDVLAGGAGPDLLVGGLGTDRVSYAAATTPVNVSLDGVANDGAPATGTTAAEGDQVLSTENITGGPMNDVLAGNQDANAIDGGAGDDTLVGGRGDDALDGGAGTDVASYADRPSGEPITASLDGVANDGAAGETDTFSNIEGLAGGAGNDTLTGGGGNDRLNGGAGNDTLSGLGGNDQIGGDAGDDTIDGGTGDDALSGGDGNDSLLGGAGTDTFAAGAGDDTVDGNDGTAEILGCGAGNDVAIRDASDGVDECETVRTPVPETPTAPPSAAPPTVFTPTEVTPPVDADGDGFSPPLDCDDTRANVHPGAVDIPGDRIDQDCSGADAKVPEIAAYVDASAVRVGRYVRVRQLTARRLPANTAITLTCRSKSARYCPFSSRTRTVAKPTANYILRQYFGDRKLLPGTRITVRLSAPGVVSHVVTLTLTSQGHVTRTVACLPIGAKLVAAC